MINYDFRRTVVFLSRERHSLILPRYLALAAVSGLISYSLINLQVSHLHMPDASGVWSSHDLRP